MLDGQMVDACLIFEDGTLRNNIDVDVFRDDSLLFFPPVCSQSETKLYNGSDKDVSASGGKLTKKESLKVSELKPARMLNRLNLIFPSNCASVTRVRDRQDALPLKGGTECSR